MVHQFRCQGDLRLRDAATGKELWRGALSGLFQCLQPGYADGLAIINTGYGKANLLAMKVDHATRGDVPKSAMAWDCLKRVPQRSSPIVVGDLLFTGDHGGFASCLDMKTGEVKWLERLEGKFPAHHLCRWPCHRLFGKRGVLSDRAGGGKADDRAAEQSDGMLASPAVAGNALISRTKFGRSSRRRR